jgi:hypothetical protein
MKWTATIYKPEYRECVIEYDDAVGYYLYIYENNCSFDYLQGTLEIAMKQAFEDFSVPLDAWKQVDKA